MRIGLTGLGHWHTNLHLEAFQALGQPITLLHAEGREVRRPLPSGVERCSSLDALLDRRPDLVIVLGPPDEMLRRARVLLGHRVPVGIEKPVGTSAAELQALADLARHQGTLVSVAQPHLFSEVWAAFGSEQDGPVSHFRFRLINGSPDRYRQLGVPWVLDPLVAGGGVLRNLGLHGLSAFLQLAGGAAEVGAAEVRSCLLSNALYGLETEEYAAVHLQAAGIIGQVEVGYTLGSDQGSEFEMTLHRLGRSVRDDGRTITVLDRRSGQTTVTPCLPLERRYEQFARVTLEALRGTGAGVHSLDDHLRAMTLVDRCYQVGRRVGA